MTARQIAMVDNLTAAAWSQVFHAAQQELEAKFNGDAALSLRWTAIREEATRRANVLEAKRNA